MLPQCSSVTKPSFGFKGNDPCSVLLQVLDYGGRTAGSGLLLFIDASAIGEYNLRQVWGLEGIRPLLLTLCTPHLVSFCKKHRTSHNCGRD